MSGLPRAVREQQRKADELHAQMYSKGQETGDEPAPAEEGATEEGQQQQPEQQAQDPQQPEQDPQQGRETDTPREPNWEQRYRSLQGKYDTEVPALSRELREARQREQQLSQEMADLRAEVQALREQGKPEGAPQGDHSGAIRVSIPKEIRERYEPEYGAEFVDIAQEIAEAVVRDYMRQKVQPLESQINETRREVSEVGRAVSDREFFTELRDRVPDWDQVDRDEAWLAWLAEYEPLTGKTRQNALDEAYKERDHVRVAALFNAFKGGRQPASRKPEIESQIAPGKRGGGAEPTPKPRYTLDDWTRLQEDARKGLYVGREEEFRKKERDIHASVFART